MDRVTIREREALEKEEEEREKENKKQEALRKSESKRVRREGGRGWGERGGEGDGGRRRNNKAMIENLRGRLGGNISDVCIHTYIYLIFTPPHPHTLTPSHPHSW